MLVLLIRKIPFTFRVVKFFSMTHDRAVSCAAAAIISRFPSRARTKEGGENFSRHIDEEDTGTQTVDGKSFPFIALAPSLNLKADNLQDFQVLMKSDCVSLWQDDASAGDGGLGVGGLGGVLRGGCGGARPLCASARWAVAPLFFLNPCNLK